MGYIYSFISSEFLRKHFEYQIVFVYQLFVLLIHLQSSVPRILVELSDNRCHLFTVTYHLRTFTIPPFISTSLLFLMCLHRTKFNFVLSITSRKIVSLKHVSVHILSPLFVESDLLVVQVYKSVLTWTIPDHCRSLSTTTLCYFFSSSTFSITPP